MRKKNAACRFFNSPKELFQIFLLAKRVDLSCYLWSIYDIVSHCFASDPSCKSKRSGGAEESHEPEVQNTFHATKNKTVLLLDPELAIKSMDFAKTFGFPPRV